MCQFPEEFQTLYSARLGPANLAFKFQDAIVYRPHWQRGNGSIEQSYGIFPESSFSIWACFLEAHGGVHTCLLCPWACQPLQELCGSFIGAPNGVNVSYHQLPWLWMGTHTAVGLCGKWECRFFPPKEPFACCFLEGRMMRIFREAS